MGIKQWQPMTAHPVQRHKMPPLATWNLGGLGTFWGNERRFIWILSRSVLSLKWTNKYKVIILKKLVSANVCVRISIPVSPGHPCRLGSCQFLHCGLCHEERIHTPPHPFFFSFLKQFVWPNQEESLLSLVLSQQTCVMIIFVAGDTNIFPALFSGLRVLNDLGCP